MRTIAIFCALTLAAACGAPGPVELDPTPEVDGGATAPDAYTAPDQVAPELDAGSRRDAPAETSSNREASSTMPDAGDGGAALVPDTGGSTVTADAGPDAVDGAPNANDAAGVGRTAEIEAAFRNYPCGYPGAPANVCGGFAHTTPVYYVETVPLVCAGGHWTEAPAGSFSCSSGCAANHICP